MTTPAATVLHVDMDAFFAAVELRDRPDLRGRPVIVGRPNGRGVVVSATYEARAFGVHSALPMGRAMRACPDATIIEPTRASTPRRVATSWRCYATSVPVLMKSRRRGLSRRFWGTPDPGVTSMVAELSGPVIASELELPSSVGVATVTMVAKIASTLAKPDGVLIVPAADTVRFFTLCQSVDCGEWGVRP